MASPEHGEALAAAARADCARLSEAIAVVDQARVRLVYAAAALARVRSWHVQPLTVSEREDLATAAFRVSIAREAMEQECDSLAELLVRLRQRWGVRP